MGEALTRIHQHVSARSVHYTMILLIVAYATLAPIWWLTRGVDVYLPTASPVLAAGTAGAVAAFAIRPRSLRLYRMAGYMAVMTLLFRTAQVVLNILDGGAYTSPWSGVSAVVLYIFLFFLLGRTWDRDVREWTYHNREN